MGKCALLVEHISSVVLDTKTLYYRKEADKFPQSMWSDNCLTWQDINHWHTVSGKKSKKILSYNIWFNISTDLLIYGRVLMRNVTTMTVL